MVKAETERTEAIANDPLRKLRNDALKISQNLISNDSTLEVNVVGALHEGIPASDILNLVAGAHAVSLELPSIAVKAHLNGEPTKVDGNGFWGTIMNEAKRSSGVNNNRAAVNGIRILDDRLRPEQNNVPSGVPDVIVGGWQVSGGQEFEVGQLSDEEILRDISTQEPRFGGKYPGRAFVLQNGRDYFLHVNRPTQDRQALSAVFVGNRYMLPTEYFMRRGAGIFGEEVGGISGIELSEFALSHLLRLNVDKTQIKGLLSEVIDLSKQIEGQNIQMIHVGGAAHNPNLLGILREVFSPFDNVVVKEVRDQRMPGPASDNLTFFGSHIHPVEGLSATAVLQDQVVVDVSRTDALLGRVSKENSAELVDFGRREFIARKYEDFIGESDNSGQVEFFTVRNLLSHIPPEVITQVPRIDRDFPYYLAELIITRDPDQYDNVIELMSKFESRHDNFPKRVQN